MFSNSVDRNNIGVYDERDGCRRIIRDELGRLEPCLRETRLELELSWECQHNASTSWNQVGCDEVELDLHSYVALPLHGRPDHSRYEIIWLRRWEEGTHRVYDSHRLELNSRETRLSVD